MKKVTDEQIAEFREATQKVLGEIGDREIELIAPVSRDGAVRRPALYSQEQLDGFKMTVQDALKSIASKKTTIAGCRIESMMSVELDMDELNASSLEELRSKVSCEDIATLTEDSMSFFLTPYTLNEKGEKVFHSNLGFEVNE